MRDQSYPRAAVYLQQIDNLQAPPDNPAGLHSQEYQEQFIPYSGGTLHGV